MVELRALHIVVLAAPGIEGSTRRRTYALVCAYPGLHQSEVARRLGVTSPAAEHHLRNLVRAGLLTADRGSGTTTYFPAVQGNDPGRSVPPPDKKKVALFRQRRPLEILGLLLLHNELVMQDLAGRMQVSASTVTHHVAKLERADLVQRSRDGRTNRVSLIDRDGLINLLLNYEPPQDMRAGFEELWNDLGV